MNVQPASHLSLRLPPGSAMRLEPALADRYAPPGRDRMEPADLTGFAQQPMDPVASVSSQRLATAGELPVQQVVAGPPLPIPATQSGVLPQDRSPAMPAAARLQPATRSAVSAAAHSFAGTNPVGWGPAGLHWLSPPPGMLTALQDGGRARIAALYP